MRRIYHPYTLWEDWINGMWDKMSPEIESEMLQKAIDFTGNDNLYGKAMLRAITEWPITCEHNLTDKSINYKAFIGHCAVCLELGIPEYITRSAWKLLTDEQRLLANNKAEIAFKVWRSNYKRKTNKYQLQFDFMYEN